MAQDNPILQNFSNATLSDYTSKLGTKEHWESTYKEDIELFKNNSEECGEIWFGKQLQKKIVNFIKENFPVKNARILDIGCGNGIFLYKLCKNGYSNLWGIDYSEASVELAKMIIKQKDSKKNRKFPINFFCEDINNTAHIINGKFDIIHDKGAMDAYLLNKNNTLEKYKAYLKSYSKNGTIFIITSCNNTREELKEKFTEKEGYSFINEIQNKTFTFGGHSGQQAATQIYKINLV